MDQLAEEGQTETRPVHVSEEEFAHRFQQNVMRESGCAEGVDEAGSIDYVIIVDFSPTIGTL